MTEINPAEARVMRAIVAREHKKAIAERVEANARPPAIAPSTAGWKTKPDKRRKPTAAEREIADAARLAKRAWAQRHPAAAQAERALRKARAEMLDRWDHKRHGTAETHEHFARRQDGSLARLYMSGGIDAEQLAVAVDISEVAERIGADVTVSVASFEARVDVTRNGDGTFYEALHWVRREVAYTRWRAQVQGPIAAVLDMIVGEYGQGPVGFTVVAARYGIHNRKAKRILIDALDLWPRILGPVCKEIDQAALDAAQAGVLA